LSAIETASPASAGDAISLSKEPANTMPTSRADIRSERGQTMVEFALILPVLCVVLFSIIQFGLLYNSYITLTDATRVGARKAAVSRQAANPAALAEAATRSSAGGLKQVDLKVFVTATAWAPGADVTVEATYPYDVNVLGVVVSSGTLRSKTVERVE
jgi:Flp pilus assembly protein TadG